MKDSQGHALKALWNSQEYTVGWMDAGQGKVQIALPVENTGKAYFVKVVKISEVSFVIA